MVILARELVNRGYEVSFITYDDNLEITDSLDGIRIIRTCGPKAGFPIIRFIYPKLDSLWKALKRADADVYIKRTASSADGFIAKYCQLRNRKYIFSSSSDRDVVHLSVPIHEYENSLKYRLIRIRDNLLFRYGLRLTDAIVVQSEFQKKWLKQKTNLASEVIRSFCPVDRNASIPVEREHILWIGGIHSKVKNIELLYRIAKEFPMEKFLVIGRTWRHAEKRPIAYQTEFENIQFLGAVPHDEIGQYYRAAKFYLNTSIQEGFPNTFLEAWARSTPVVSVFVDPDEIICRHQLGFHSKNLEKAIKQIRSLLDDTSLSERFGRNGQRYVEKFHDVGKIAESWDSRIKRVLSNPKKVDGRFSIWP